MSGRNVHIYDRDFPEWRSTNNFLLSIGTRFQEMEKLSSDYQYDIPLTSYLIKATR